MITTNLTGFNNKQTPFGAKVNLKEYNPWAKVVKDVDKIIESKHDNDIFQLAEQLHATKDNAQRVTVNNCEKLFKKLENLTGLKLQRINENASPSAQAPDFPGKDIFIKTEGNKYNVLISEMFCDCPSLSGGGEKISISGEKSS